MGDVIVGVYYRPPDQEEEVDEACCKQSHNHRLWFSMETSTTLTSAGKISQAHAVLEVPTEHR